MKVLSLMKSLLRFLFAAVPGPRLFGDKRNRMFPGTSIAVLANVARRVRVGYLSLLIPPFMLLLVLGVSVAGEKAVGNAAPIWKVGRTVIEWRAQTPTQNTPGRNIPVVKLSLRNEGGAGSMIVQIYGRWSSQATASQAPVLLGQYAKEVALTRTAILEVPLTPLAFTRTPQGKITLEMIVTTGGKETDRKWIAWN